MSDFIDKYIVFVVFESRYLTTSMTFLTLIGIPAYQLPNPY
jgi:hypothetical protein